MSFAQPMSVAEATASYEMRWLLFSSLQDS